ncbi:MAG: hypothetical protein IKG98_11840 [Ruminococcus sp.]|jgi:hypothetical protein|nr:hypothetical protein [Ruminococcus sp.]
MNNDILAPENRSPEELAELIDKLFSQGSGHINVTYDDNGDGLKVNTVKSTDICGVKGACCQPTEDAVDNE